MFDQTLSKVRPVTMFSFYPTGKRLKLSKQGLNFITKNPSTSQDKSSPNQLNHRLKKADSFTPATLQSANFRSNTNSNNVTNNNVNNNTNPSNSREQNIGHKGYQTSNNFFRPRKISSKSGRQSNQANVNRRMQNVKGMHGIQGYFNPNEKFRSMRVNSIDQQNSLSNKLFEQFINHYETRVKKVLYDLNMAQGLNKPITSQGGRLQRGRTMGGSLSKNQTNSNSNLFKYLPFLHSPKGVHYMKGYNQMINNMNVNMNMNMNMNININRIGSDNSLQETYLFPTKNSYNNFNSNLNILANMNSMQNINKKNSLGKNMNSYNNFNSLGSSINLNTTGNGNTFSNTTVNNNLAVESTNSNNGNNNIIFGSKNTNSIGNINNFSYNTNTIRSMNSMTGIKNAKNFLNGKPLSSKGNLQNLIGDKERGENKMEEESEGIMRKNEGRQRALSTAPTNKNHNFDQKYNQDLDFRQSNKGMNQNGTMVSLSTLGMKESKQDKLLKYEKGHSLGKGAYAEVIEVINKINNVRYAMKVYKKEKLNDNAKKKCVYKEIEILKRLNHKNIAKLVEVIHTPKEILIVQELVNGISLRYYYNKEIRNQKFIEERKDRILRKIFKQIFDAMNYVHKNHMAHRDIKLENILIDKNYEVKIIDFGFGMFNPECKLQTFFCGTPNYMPPEIVMKKPYVGQKADLWSLGVLVYKMYCADFPFKGKTEKDLYNSIRKGKFTIANYVPEYARRIIIAMIDVEPNRRATCEQVLLSQWLRD